MYDAVGEFLFGGSHRSRSNIRPSLLALLKLIAFPLYTSIRSGNQFCDGLRFACGWRIVTGEPITIGSAKRSVTKSANTA
jgi:hypothetical protein